MYHQDEILEFIKMQTGVDELNPNEDLMYDHGVSGDDFHELIAEYQKKFNVDMTNYLWYFHTDEEGSNIGAAFFKTPYQRVGHIPVTPSKLLEFANKGYWDIKYPEHTLPRFRWDLIINSVLIIVFLSWILYSCLK